MLSLKRAILCNCRLGETVLFIAIIGSKWIMNHLFSRNAIESNTQVPPVRQNKKSICILLRYKKLFVFVHAFGNTKLLLKDLSVYFKMNYIMHKRVGCVYLRLSTYFSLGKKILLTWLGIHLSWQMLKTAIVKICCTGNLKHMYDIILHAVWLI